MIAYIYRFLLVTILCAHTCTAMPQDAVTFELNGGRFGDNLISCSQAYWMHYRYNLPLLFKPFPYSEHLCMYYEHTLFTRKIAQEFKQSRYVKSGDALQEEADKKTDATLYITTFAHDPGVDWSDVEFVDRFRAAISPVDANWRYRKMPEDVHSIAMHVRRGGGFAYDKRIHAHVPQQFPSLNFYIHALQLVLDHLDGPCHVYLFTDDTKPKALAKKIGKHLSPADQARVRIISRNQQHDAATDVLSDFFDMMQCKYLIRPCSHFSLFVEQLGTCSVSIYPARATYRKKKWGQVTDIFVSTFVEGASSRERINLSEYAEKKQVPILQKADVREILLDPALRTVNRRLKSRLVPCY
jgi:hypothetical protein